MAQQNKPVIWRAIVQMVIVVLVAPFLPMIISGDWGWWEAWAYLAINVLGFFISRLLAAKRNPGILQERARYLDHKDIKAWDRTLAFLLGIGGVFIQVTPGLERLFGGTSYSLAMRLTGLALLILGNFWTSYALVKNRFFSGVVRIQRERGQQVVSDGPYAVMRHPGYAGALLLYLGIPLLLESWWSWVPVVYTAAVMVVRTRLEDRTLQEELEGYRDYARRVRYRLIPGLW